MRHSLLELTEKQWEDLCDGCGRCCTVKLQDEDTDEIHFTNVACEFLDTDSCRCSDYSNRTTNKPECMVLDRTDLSKLSMMPFTCAYRRTGGQTITFQVMVLHRMSMVCAGDVSMMPLNFVRWQQRYPYA